MTFIGIDNGATGTIGIIPSAGPQFASIHKMPSMESLNYQKSKVTYVTRIDHYALRELLQGLEHKSGLRAVVERPFTMASATKAVLNAQRALESVIINLELLDIGYEFIDSKLWQKAFLPPGLKGAALKQGSLDVGKRMFPHIEWDGFKDADGLLIAEYARRHNGAD